MNKLLKDCLPHEFMSSEYQNIYTRRFSDELVISEHSNNWPGGHKNVHYWVTLKNGKRVGWNKSPTHGWSFPTIGAA